MNEKVCSSCRLSKAPVYFHKRSASRDGLQARCKACIATDDRSEEGRRYRERHAEACRQRNREWAANNPDRVAAACKRWRATEAGLASGRKRQAWRRSAQRLAVVAWADQALIADIYRLAAIYTECGIAAHVDHIVPLTSEFVCGLHTHHNLTVLTASENLRKKNRFQP